MSYENLLVVKRDGLAVVTVNRPDKLNALNAQTIAELGRCFEDLAGDATVGGVILTGSGQKAFVAGADIAELAQQSPADGFETARRGQGVLDRIERLGKPVIAAVNGFALGGGCELALACHLRVASETARLGTPEVTLGLMCGYAGTQRLPRLVGRGAALEMLLSGQMLKADEAWRIGLVNRVVPQAELLAECETLLQKILANGPVAIRHTLDAVAHGLDVSLAEGQEHEAALFGLLCATDDAKEGTAAFLAKHPPKFEGK